MSPTELMELAERVDGLRFDPAACKDAAAALRSYAELLSQLDWLKESRPDLAYVKLNQVSINTCAKFLGWPGLEAHDRG